MSTITVVTVDAGGNVPPTLRIADELARRGHRVEVLGHARQADAITSIGLGFRSLASLDFWDPSVRKSIPAAIDRIVRLAADPGIEREVRGAVAAAGSDVALVDCLMPSSLRGAHAGGARTAALFHTFLAFWIRGYERGPAGLVSRLRGTDPLRAWARADARLVASDFTLDPNLQNRDVEKDHHQPASVGMPVPQLSRTSSPGAASTVSCLVKRVLNARTVCWPGSIVRLIA